MSNQTAPQGTDSNFSYITKKLTEDYTRKDVLIPVFKYMQNNKQLYIILLYKKSTTLNLFKDDIYFSITLTENYPQAPPSVKCLSNFYSVSLFDNRNFLYSIINHNWTPNTKDTFEPIEEIIMQIPVFLQKIKENSTNRTLVYYGDYTIDDIYDINDFLANKEMKFYRVDQHTKKKNESYVILTDIYFLLLEPSPDAKNLGKLLFFGDIRQLENYEKGSIKEEETIKISYTGRERDVKFEFSVIKGKVDDLVDEAKIKIKRLKDNFDIYQEDEVKEGDSTCSLFKEKISKEDLGKIKELIEYKEKLLQEKKTLHLIKELTLLYEKVIELLSAENEPSYQQYLDKLKQMLAEEETLDHIEQEEKTKSCFKMSKSYVDDCK